VFALVVHDAVIVVVATLDPLVVLAAADAAAVSAVAAVAAAAAVAVACFLNIACSGYQRRKGCNKIFDESL